jgi:transcriptional regulator with XRE-family HTH domain
MSQEKLGESLGITFQQVQKYEKGSNRMGAGRLQQVAILLGVPVAYLYEGAPDVPPVGDDATLTSLPSVILAADEAALIESFRRLTDAKLRRRVQQLVEAMADG